VPIAWFPRLAYGTDTEHSNWRLIGNGGMVSVGRAWMKISAWREPAWQAADRRKPRIAADVDAEQKQITVVGWGYSSQGQAE